jgi:hypothetical protein
MPLLRTGHALQQHRHYPAIPAEKEDAFYPRGSPMHSFCDLLAHQHRHIQFSKDSLTPMQPRCCRPPHTRRQVEGLTIEPDVGLHHGVRLLRPDAVRRSSFTGAPRANRLSLRNYRPATATPQLPMLSGRAFLSFLKLGPCRTPACALPLLLAQPLLSPREHRIARSERDIKIRI